MVKIIHSIHFPVSARAFVYPIVQHLQAAGVDAELWLEDSDQHQAVIQSLDVPTCLLESDITLNPIRFFQRLQHYRKQLQQSKPQVLHAHQTRASLIPLLAAWLERVPTRIYHNHGIPYLGYRGTMRWFLYGLEKLNIQLSTHVLCVSRSNLTEAQADGLLPSDAGSVLGHGSAIGIDPETYAVVGSSEFSQAARSEFNLPQDAFILGYVGRPVQRKGFHLLLETWEQSNLAAQGHILLLAGCTTAEVETAMGRAIAGVKGLGYLSDMQHFYGACDAITLPSMHEGFSYALLEAAAAGKPLIGSDIPGNRCAIVHDETGVLIPLHNPTALADAFTTFAQDKTLRTTVGQAAQQRVQHQFSRQYVLDKLLDFYRDEVKLAI